MPGINAPNKKQKRSALENFAQGLGFLKTAIGIGSGLKDLKGFSDQQNLKNQGQ